MRYSLLVNPTSRGGAARRAARPVAELLRGSGAQVRVTATQDATTAGQVAAESGARGEVVVAVGGDGTVASVVGAVVAVGGILGVVPAGRGNDFARALGMPADPLEAARLMLGAQPREVDVIEVNGGGLERHVVAGSVYAGVDSLTAELVDRLTWLPHRLQYPVAAVRALAASRPTRYRVAVDGVEHSETGFTVVVANSPYYGSGMRIAPRASLDDGELDVVVIRAASRWRLARSIPRLYTGTHVDMDEVVVMRGREVHLEANGVLRAAGDGEGLGRLPLRVRVRPAALRVLA